jgi:hypothetical protein
MGWGWGPPPLCLVEQTTTFEQNRLFIFTKSTYHFHKINFKDLLPVLASRACLNSVPRQERNELSPDLEFLELLRQENL